MEFSVYQTESRKTAKYPDIGDSFVYPVLGLVGEAGEMVNKVKKIYRDDEGTLTAERKEMLQNELGDMLWYIAQLATELNIDLNDIARINLERTQGRKLRGTITGDGDNR